MAEKPLRHIYSKACALAGALLLAACNNTPESFLVRDDNFRDSPWKYVKERLTARPLKKTLFGAPSSVNQQMENESFEDSMRWVRNGTLESRRYAIMDKRKLRKKLAEANPYAEMRRDRQDIAYAYGGGGAGAGSYPGQGRVVDPYSNRYETMPQAMGPPPRGKYDISNDKPPASPYGMGFEDGCKTYMAAIGAGSWRLLKPRYNMQLMGETMNVEYIRGFNDAATFCTFRTDWDPH